MVKIKAKIYAEALYTLCQKKANLDIVLPKFIKVLANYNALSQIEEIIKYFSNFYDKNTNSLDVMVDTACELDEQSKKEIIKLIKSMVKVDQVNLKIKLKPELLGGLILNFADWQIDASLKRQLQNLKNNINN